MPRTVGDVARLTGLTVRTLHHYDEIGLLVPSARTDAGYRMYGEAEMLRLHDILVLREAGLPLDEIARLLDDPGRDVGSSLRLHRRQLTARVRDLEGRIEAIDRLIERTETGETMDDELLAELFEGFDPTAHRDEARERWGHTDAYAVSQLRVKQMEPDDWRLLKQEGDEITDGFARLFRNGVPANSDEAAQLVRAQRDHMARFYPVTPEVHRSLGDMYVEDVRFRETYDPVEPGLAAYIRDAVLAAD